MAFWMNEMLDKLSLQKMKKEMKCMFTFTVRKLEIKAVCSVIEQVKYGEGVENCRKWSSRNTALRVRMNIALKGPCFCVITK